MNLTDAPDVLTVEEAREVLNVSRGTLYAAIREGQISHVRIGRCIRIPKHRLEAMLGSRSFNDVDPAGEAGSIVTPSAGSGRHGTE